MHPIVVSLHNSVPCFSFDNYGVSHLRLFVNKNSSKIYHIMREFGVEENRVACLSPFYKVPSPDYVYNKLCTFDKEKVTKKAKCYYEIYRQMMNNIIDSFTNEK